MLRSFSSGCDTATWKPACRVGSKLLIGLLVVVRALSHEALQVPPPKGRRCRTPVDQNESLTSAPLSPRKRFVEGVALLEWPKVVESTGANAPRLSPTRAAAPSGPSRTVARPGLFSAARRTAASSVSRNVAEERVWGGPP